MSPVIYQVLDGTERERGTCVRGLLCLNSDTSLTFMCYLWDAETTNVC